MSVPTCLCEMCLEVMLESERCEGCIANNVTYCVKCHTKMGD